MVPRTRPGTHKGHILTKKGAKVVARFIGVKAGIVEGAQLGLTEGMIIASKLGFFEEMLLYLYVYFMMRQLYYSITVKINLFLNLYV